MKIIIASFLCLLLAVVPFVPADVLQKIPADVDIEYWRTLLIPALSIFIFLDAFICKFACKKEDYFAQLRKYPEEPDEEAAKRIADLIDTVQNDNLALIEGKETLQTALQEAHAKIKELQAAPEGGLKRDAQIDAELVNLLALLQEKGRIIDFLMDDITAYPDAQVGAAARVVHEGCLSVLKEYFDIQSIHDGKEGEPVELQEGYDTQKFRLVGKVGGQAPFKGTLLHHGWIVNKITLPRLVKGGEELEKHRVITPAEIEMK